MVLVDTPVWSLALRRRSVDLSPSDQGLIQSLSGLVRKREVQLLGPIRQEVLSGIREESQFLRIRDHLRGFPDIEINTIDYEHAARISNQCRQQGITGTSVDMLICALSIRHGWEIFTTDRDFIHYGRVTSLRMFTA